MKKCTCCNKEKALKEFGKRKRKLSNGKVKIEYLTQCKKCVNEKSKTYYKDKIKDSVNVVYRFLDKEGSVLYVGKTQSLPHRVMQHTSKKGHLPKECLDAIDKIEFIAMESTVLMDIKELYYINIYRPKYNFNNVYSEPSIIIPGLGGDKWEDISEFEKAKQTQSFKLNDIKNWGTIFYRHRGNRYVVYIEFKHGGKKHQIKKGSFENEQDAKDLVDKLKKEKEYIKNMIYST